VLRVAVDFVTHAHAEAHVIIWLEGASGEMTIGGATVRPDRSIAAAINPFQPHSHVLSGDGGPGLFLAVYIDPDWIRHRLGLVDHRPIFRSPAIALSPGMRSIAASLAEPDDSADHDCGLGMEYETERFIDTLIAAAATPRPGRAATYPARDFRIQKALVLMKANLGDRVCLDRIARDVGLSRPHFFALFREQMNLTPNVYWNSLRMAEALRQMQTAHEPLNSVACNLGFTSQGNFSRFFREHAGVAPTLYRSAALASVQ
jgi:AraC-like DNA-binding protein